MWDESDSSRGDEIEEIEEIVAVLLTGDKSLFIKERN
jgi:hypothetical protein